MGFARVRTAQPGYPRGTLVVVEAESQRGIPPGVTIVGLADKAVTEARERVLAATRSWGNGPSTPFRTTVSLAPADVRKEGTGYDLPVAIALLASQGTIAAPPPHTAFVGELALDGSLRPVRGVLAIAHTLATSGIHEVVVPAENAAEAALVSRLHVYGASSLAEVLNHLAGNSPLALTPTAPPEPRKKQELPTIDLSDIRGQLHAKRALEIAAAGGHNLALWGPPGTGKTMLARALAHLLPPLTPHEAMEVSLLHSLAGTLPRATLITHPPFRAPHHTASPVAIVGGGNSLRPGEITLAHRGVLFLDECTEFDRRVLEALREPLEEGVVTVARAAGAVTYPARAMVVIAFNPSRGHERNETFIDPREQRRLLSKLSGPLVDRIDLWVRVGAIDAAALEGAPTGPTSEEVRARVAAAREVQLQAGGLSTTLAAPALSSIPLDPEGRKLLKDAVDRLNLSARSYHRVLRVARTIASLAGTREVQAPAIQEALSFRPRLPGIAETW